MSTSRTSVSLVLLVIGTSLIAVNAKLPSRLRGGGDAILGDYPWVVAIGERDDPVPICGGAIISPRHILTAAHCVPDEEPSYVIVRSGFTNIYDKNAIIRVVSEFSIHPDYEPETLDEEVRNDIAILKLKRDLPVDNPLIKIIPLVSKQPGNQHGVLAGWGDLTKRDSPPTILQTAVVKIQNANDCAVENKEDVLPQFLCGYIKNGNSYNGDSGSALVSNGEIVGVLSSGSGGRDTADYYANVYYYLDWIKSIIN